METPTLLNRARMLIIATTLGLAPAALAHGSHEDPSREQERAMGFAHDLSLAFEHASETIEPSVVHIITENTTRRGFRQRVGLGSGVIVDTDGYVLTNAHVVEAGRSISVRLADGREVPGEIVGAFSETDIAVVKIEADNLVPARFGDSEQLRVGQWVLAVGSPFGFQQSVTAGIVSAKGRGSIDTPMGNESEEAPTRFQEFIQTDAAINPGNSGGPLVDLRGRVVGINTAIASRSGGNNGLGFAIPIDIARAVMQRLIESGRVDRGWLGIQMGRLDPETAIDLGIDGGVVLERVIEGGPADHAGLESGDIVLRVGGRATENIVRFGNAIMLARPGIPVEIEYIRDGRTRTTSAVVEDRDEQFALAQGGAYIEELGLTIMPATYGPRRARRGMQPIPGYVIVEVVRQSRADKAGFEPDDFIYEIDGRAFDSAAEIADFIEDTDLRTNLRFNLIRGETKGYIDVSED